MPVRNKVGTNTAHKTSTIAISAADTSSIDALAASIAESPRSRLRSTFSTTTIASSTTTPIASTIRSEEHTSELQSLMRISYAVFCLKKKTNNDDHRYGYEGSNILQYTSSTTFNK